MAAESAKQDASAKVTPIKPKKSGKLLWIALAVLVLGAGGGAAAWFKLKAAPKAGAKAAAAAPEPVKAPLYYKLDPAFVVNFGGEGSARYLQITVEIMSRDAPVLDVIKNNDPAVRDQLVQLFSSQDNGTLMTTEGKDKLRAATLDAIRKVIDGVGGSGKLIEAVYFTSFVIQ
jgi:flagellar FliL protein